MPPEGSGGNLRAFCPDWHNVILYQPGFDLTHLMAQSQTKPDGQFCAINRRNLYLIMLSSQNSSKDL